MATCVYCGDGAGIFKIACERCRVLPEHEEFCAREQELIRRALVRNAPWSVGVLVVSIGLLHLSKGNIPEPGAWSTTKVLVGLAFALVPALVGLLGWATGTLWMIFDEDQSFRFRNFDPKEFWDGVMLCFEVSAAFLLFFLWAACALD